MIKFHLSLTFRNVDVILVRTLAALESMQINIWHQNDSIREKKAKKYFKLFEPKKFYHPRWGDLQWAKITKIFFLHFLHQNDSIRKKKQKKFLTKNLVLECVECGPKMGSK